VVPCLRNDSDRGLIGFGAARYLAYRAGLEPALGEDVGRMIEQRLPREFGVLHNESFLASELSELPTETRFAAANAPVSLTSRHGVTSTGAAAELSRARPARKEPNGAAAGSRRRPSSHALWARRPAGQPRPETVRER